MIKRIDQNGDNWIFRSDNPDYADIEIAKSELEYPILGILVGKL
jgi:SOS-response transcriptional repressor LexA